MQKRKAFTMVELVFVIVVIGILSAVAIPRFAATADSAKMSKAKSTIASVRNSIATERQRRILMGDFINPVNSLDDNIADNFIFTFFNADMNARIPPVLLYPIPICTGAATGCWINGADALNFIYRMPIGTTGTETFTLNIANGTFTCPVANNNCRLLTD